MDKNGIDHQLVGGWLDSFGYELPAAEGLAWSRFLNDCMWDELRDEPRFTPLATVPLQDGKLAAEVLGEAMDRGFGGVMIGTLPKGVRGGNLDDPSLDPFWETASRLGAAVYLHPMFVCGEARLADYDLVNAIGRLVDSSIAVSRLLYSGHLLKYTGLKFILSHGGAALPFALGRLARSHVATGGKVRRSAQGLLDDVLRLGRVRRGLVRIPGAQGRHGTRDARLRRAVSDRRSGAAEGDRQLRISGSAEDGHAGRDGAEGVPAAAGCAGQKSLTVKAMMRVLRSAVLVGASTCVVRWRAHAQTRRRTPRNPGRAGRCASSCRSRPAAAPTPSGASSRSASARSSDRTS